MLCRVGFLGGKPTDSNPICRRNHTAKNDAQCEKSVAICSNETSRLYSLKTFTIRRGAKNRVNSMNYDARKDFEKKNTKRKLHKYFSGRGFVVSRSAILKTEQRVLFLVVALKNE